MKVVSLMSSLSGPILKRFKITSSLLAKGERITSIKMILPTTLNEPFILAATFNTNKGELISCGDISPGTGRRSEVSKGHQLQYISGRAGDVVGSLQFHWSVTRNGMYLCEALKLTCRHKTTAILFSCLYIFVPITLDESQALFLFVLASLRALRSSKGDTSRHQVICIVLTAF